MPSSRYFAVAGPNERARRSRAAASSPGWSAGATLVARPHGHGLEQLRAEHGAEPAAAGVAPVVGDRRVADLPLAGGADRRHPPALAEPLAEALLGLVGGKAPEVRRGLDPGAVAVDQQRGRALGAPRTTIASLPVSLPAIAKWLDASASLRQPRERRLRRPPRTSRSWSAACPPAARSTKASGASGASGSTPTGASRCMSHVPSPTPPMKRRRTASGRGSTSADASAASTTSARPK